MVPGNPVIVETLEIHCLTVFKSCQMPKLAVLKRATETWRIIISVAADGSSGFKEFLKSVIQIFLV